MTESIDENSLAMSGFRRPLTENFPDWPWWQLGSQRMGELFIRLDTRQCRYADGELNGCRLPYPASMDKLRLLCFALNLPFEDS